MSAPEDKLQRLLAAAAKSTRDLPNEMPFGFETRVLARLREVKPDANDLRLLLRRVILVSLGVIALSAGGIFQDVRQGNFDNGESSDEYAIADDAIGSTFEQ